MVRFTKFCLFLVYSIAQKINKKHLFFDNFLGAAIIQECSLLARVRYFRIVAVDSITIGTYDSLKHPNLYDNAIEQFT